MKLQALLCFMILCLSACSSQEGNSSTSNPEMEKASKETQYSDLGKSMCNCLSPSLELFKKQQVLAQQQELGELKKLKEKQSEVIEEANKCISSLERKYKAVAEIKEENMLEVMKQSCPDVADYWSKL